MLRGLIEKIRGPQPDTGAGSCEPVARADGWIYPAPAASAARWLSSPYSFGAAGDLGARLAQLATEDMADVREREVRIPWSRFYAALASPAVDGRHDRLRLPPSASARPRVVSR